MNNDERIWLNTHLFQYKDERYGTNGTLEINTSLSTIDSTNFSPLRLNISVLNGEYNKKTCWLSFYQVSEILFNIKEITKEENLSYIYNKNNPANLERRYSKKLIRFFFKKSKDMNDCVLIGIYSNESDSNIVILTYDVFRALIEILEQFKNNYFMVENMVIDRYIRSMELEKLNCINNTIKTFPKMFEEIQINTEKFSNNNSIKKEENNNDNDDKVEDYNNKEIENTTKEFDNFIGNNIENISIPDLENIEEHDKKNNDSTIKVNSDFITKVLGNDIENLYKKTKNIILQDCKILTFNNLIKEELNINPLENVDDKSLKSSIYFSELNIRKFLKQLYLFEMEYPKTCDLVRINLNGNFDITNKELAYDLFMIQAYVKMYSVKMESRTNDQLSAKVDFYINFRLFSDIFIYSFLYNENYDVIKNNLKIRYEHFSKNGFFDTFDNELEDYNLTKITTEDIIKFSDLVLEKLSTSVDIINHHKQLYDKNLVKLPPENNFSIEQIINEIVNLEVLKNFDLDIDENYYKFDIDLEKIDKKILTMFKNNKKIKETKENQSNLYRYVKYYKDELTEDIRDSFLDYIKDLKYENFDFKNNGFQINEIGENIIKGLYQWNNMNNKKEKYTNFFHRCNETILGKSDIIDKELNYDDNLNDEESSEDWGDII